MINEPLKLTCVLAHPDDESMGTGGILAKYSRQGIGTTLVTATGGELGWFGLPAEYPGPAALASIRAEELQTAGKVLGLDRIEMLGFKDGQLDQADPEVVIAPIVQHLRSERPQVVVTFDPFGAYGHPDHIAISQYTMAAIAAAVNTDFQPESGSTHQVDKLYFLTDTPAKLAIYQQAFGKLEMEVDGAVRQVIGWPPWALTTMIDTSEFQDLILEAIKCHQSQLPNMESLINLPDGDRSRLWSEASFYRAFSLVNSGRRIESDLFTGLR